MVELSGGPVTLTRTGVSFPVVVSLENSGATPNLAKTIGIAIAPPDEETATERRPVYD